MSDRTYPATSLERKRHRDRGDVARSMEVNVALIMIAGVIALRIEGENLYLLFIHLIQSALARVGNASHYGPDDITAYLRGVVIAAVVPIVVVLALVVVAALLAQISQVGILFSPQAVMPKAAKLNVLQGLKNKLFSVDAFYEISKSLLKLGVLSWVLILAFQAHATDIQKTDQMGVTAATALLASIAFEAILKSIAVIVVVAAGDYAFHRWRYESKLKMTRSAYIQDLKSMESPLAAQREISKRQSSARRARGIGDVKRADFVARNPQHLAVAVRYDPKEMSTPYVIAKGAGLWARRILEEAALHNIPTIENKPLARVLYHGVEVGAPIPISLWAAVIEIIAAVRTADAARRR